MPQSVAEQPVELFGIIRKLPGIIRLVSGDLEVYRLSKIAAAETIVRTFKEHEIPFEISEEQFFYGSNHFHCTIGFVRFRDNEVRVCRRIGDLWTRPPDCEARSTLDVGTTIFAPASQALAQPSWRKTIIIRF